MTGDRAAGVGHLLGSDADRRGASSSAPGEAVPAPRFLAPPEDCRITLVSTLATQTRRTEVTVAQFKACMDDGGCGQTKDWDQCNWGKPGKEQYPANCLWWAQADGYCKWAGKRLPTEAEWEKTARGTDGRTYPWGNQPVTCDYAVIATTQFGLVEGCGTGGSWAVGKKPKGDSPYGLHDMSGNVSEWVADWWKNDYYAVSPLYNPQGPTTSSSKVLRGGSFKDVTHYMRASERHDDGNGPLVTSVDYGFRCVWSE